MDCAYYYCRMFTGVTTIPTGYLIFWYASQYSRSSFKLDILGTLRLGFFTIFAFLFVDVFDTLERHGTGARQVFG